MILNDATYAMTSRECHSEYSEESRASERLGPARCHAERSEESRASK